LREQKKKGDFSIYNRNDCEKQNKKTTKQTTPKQGNCTNSISCPVNSHYCANKQTHFVGRKPKPDRRREQQQWVPQKEPAQSVGMLQTMRKKVTVQVT
jgi:hypothetical protein